LSQVRPASSLGSGESAYPDSTGGEVLTKQEFIEKVADRANLQRRDAQKAVEAVLDTITDALTQGDEVAFTGFGKFTTQHRKERQGVNPRNPTEKVTIPASTVPKFSAGSALKTAVRGR